MLTQHPLGWRTPESVGRAPHAGHRLATSADLDTLPREVRLAGLPEVYDGAASGTAQALAGAVRASCTRAAGTRPSGPTGVALTASAAKRALVGEDSGAILADGIDALRDGYEPEREHPLAWGPAWLDPPSPRSADAPRLVSAEPLAIDVPSACWDLAAGHPLVVGLAITTAWEDFDGDTLPPPTGPSIGGHAVLLIGYRRAADGSVEFRVRNSWGGAWKDAGEAWLPAAWLAPWCGSCTRCARGVARWAVRCEAARAGGAPALRVPT